MAKLVLGCGYLGMRVAQRWKQQAADVYVLTRSAERAQKLAGSGLIPVVGDVTLDDPWPVLPEVDTVLFAIGFDRSSGKRIHEVYVDGLRRTLERLSRQIHQFIYISSTGVFGQTAGEVVTEQSPCHPNREGGRACWEAEQLLAAHPLGRRSVVLRLAGIYGPGRIPKLDEVRAGRPVVADPDACLNLIHVDDAVEVVLQAETRAVPPALYLVSDGHPVRRRDFYEYLAQLVGAPRPTFETVAGGDENARGGGDKRVDPSRMLQELQPLLNYPTFREGLAQIVTDTAKP